MKHSIIILCIVLCPVILPAQEHIHVGGVFPHLAMTAGHSPRTEAGTGALFPWADRLWVITYVAHLDRSGSGTGLYEINEKMELRKRPESVVGTYANRLLHGESNQLIIGPHVIDVNGNVRTIDGVKGHRLAATLTHLTDPADKVYFLAMEGEFFEVNIHTLETRLLFNLMDELKEPKGSKPHFKSGFTRHGRVVVCNNSYSVPDYNKAWSAGRLAEWDGKTWKILEEKPFTEVWSASSFGAPILATGWDNASAVLKVFLPEAKRWITYRLPKASKSFDETSNTEWLRIREVETERALMDCHGLFYEVGFHLYAEQLWAIKPVCSHLRVIPDFCSWKGLLVLGGNQGTPMKFGPADANPLAGQPQAGLWFGKTDDLWSWGKPAGEGGVWYDDAVVANQPSDPYLMYGFDKKSLHLWHDNTTDVTFNIEVDVTGNGAFRTYDRKTVKTGEYLHHEFPDGYNARWIRITPDKNCKATAWFIYN
ncbi:MAG: hypothetical protein LBQ73_10785 [Tannerellaceae bacterium]|jgi:hypothetical protein|nr:hypothetical protein [Tannerellaceae bacterium]